jgi:phosphate-selective porin
MKKIIALTLAVSAVAASSAFAIEPIKGSITYTNPNEVRLTKAPAGSLFNHQFVNDGQQYKEIYKVQADGSVMIVDRQRVDSNSMESMN